MKMDWWNKLDRNSIAHWFVICFIVYNQSFELSKAIIVMIKTVFEHGSVDLYVRR